MACAAFWFLVYETISKDRKHGHFYFRKIVHFSGISFFFAYFFVPKIYLIAFLAIVSVIFIISEFARMRKVYLPIVHEMTIYCSKKGESDDIVLAPLLFSFGILFLLFLPEKSFIIGSLTLIVGDTFAGTIGYGYGTHKLFFSKIKTAEGTAAFALSSFIALSIFFDPLTALIFSVIGAIIESVFVKYENFAIPFLIGLIALFI
jgi:dolichol kinase